MSKFFKILLIIVLVFVGLVITGVIVLTQTSLLKNRASALLNERLGSSTRLQIRIGDLSGSYLDGIAADSVVLTTDGDGALDTVAVVGRVEARYSASNILGGQFRIRRLAITNPRIFVPRDSVIAYLQSLFTDTGSAAAGRPPSAFEIDTLVITNGAILHADDSSVVAEAINLLLEIRQSGTGAHAVVHSGTAQVERLGTVTARADLHYVDRQVSFDSVAIRTNRSNIWLSGTSQHFTIKTTPIDLAEVELFRPIGVDGQLRFDGAIASDSTRDVWTLVGTVSGSLDRYELEDVRVRLSVDSTGVVVDSVAGHISGARWRGSGLLDWRLVPMAWSYEGAVSNFDLQRYVPNAVRTNISGNVSVAGHGSTEQDFVARCDVRLGAGAIAMIDMDAAIGSLTACAESLVVDGGFIVELNATRLSVSGRVDYNDSLDVVADFECSDLTAWREYLPVESLSGAGGGFVYFSGPTDDPDLSGVIESDSLRLFDLVTSSFHGRFHVPRFLSDPSGSLEAHLGSSDVWGIATDSITLSAAVAGHQITLDWIDWSTPGHHLEGAGVLDIAGDSIPLSLYPLSIDWDGRRYSAGDSLRFVFTPVGIDVRSLQFEGPLGILTANGRYNYDAGMSFVFSVDHFRLDAVRRWFLPHRPMDGLMVISGRIAGTVQSPTFAIDGTISDVEYDQRPYGDITLAVSYADRRLDVANLHLQNDDFTVDIAGSFPIDLSPTPVGSRILDEPMRGRLIASGEVLDRLAVLQDQTLESIQGPFAISAIVEGTPHAPRLSGDAHLRGGRIKLLDFVDPLENAQVDLILRQDTIIIERAEMVVGEGKDKGRVDASGSVRIVTYDDLDYNVRVKGHKVPARFEFVDWVAQADFDLTVRGSAPPFMSGTIRPQRFVDREPFDDDDAPRAEDTTLWDWDLTVDVPGNYWIHNDQIEAEMSAQMRILRQRGLINFVGEAEVVRGKVNFFDRVGRIERGVLTFDDPNTPDPTLDIDVVFRIQQPRVEAAGPGATSEVVDLRMHVGGRASEPLIQPEPPYTEEDVLLLLAANATSATSGDPFADRLRFAATGLVFSEVQRAAARRLGLETLEIESGGSASDTRITIGRYLSPQFYLYGASPVASGSGQEVGFEYRFSRRLYLEGNRDRDNNYRLNLHINWDY